MIRKMSVAMAGGIVLLLFQMGGSALALDDVDVHGFISQGYVDSSKNNFFGDTENGSFEFDEFGINFSGEPMEKLRIGLQLLARDFGSNGNNEVVIDWAYGDYRWRDWLGIRAGKIKTPKGLYNETRDEDMLRTAIFLPQSVYPEILRDTDLGLLGGGLYGYVGLYNGGMISYQFLYGTQEVESNEAVSQALQATTAWNTPIENRSIDVESKLAVSMVWDSPLEGLRVGVTYDRSVLSATAEVIEEIPDAEEGDILYSDFDKFENSVFSMEYTRGRFLLAGEYIRTVRDFAIAFNDTYHEELKVVSDGWYLGADYQVTDWFHLGTYCSESYNDIDDRDGSDLTDTGNDNPNRAYLKDGCLTTCFLINNYWSIKLEGHLRKGTNGVSPLDQVPDETGRIFAEENWSLFAAKMTFNF